MGKRNKNLKDLYPNALPVTLSSDVYGPLPDIYPHNPLSWIYFVGTYLYIQSRPVPEHKVRVEYSNGIFTVCNDKDMARLWSHGFFGKGSLSRSDPSWVERTSRRLGLDNDSGISSEDITKQRREERKRFKAERAKVEALELKQRQGLLSPSEESILLDLKEELNDFKQKSILASNQVNDLILREEDEILLAEGVNLEYLQLQVVEVFFLQFALDTLSIYKDDHLLSTSEVFYECCKLNPKFLLDYVVYHHYRSLGWCVRAGIKFGCDMLLYKRGPPFSHAEFGILIVSTKLRLDWIEISSISRVIGGVKKSLVLCFVDEPSESQTTSAGDIHSLLSSYKVTEVLYRRWIPSRSRD